MHPMLTIAIRAARKAGNLVAKNYEAGDTTATSQDGNSDAVTSVRHDTEYLITDVIRKAYPQHTISSAACSALTDDCHGTQWVIDPLDGPANFLRRLPHFAVSIAARVKGHTEVAVVYDPMRNELFTAVRGQGAQLNGYRLRCTQAKELDGTLLATGFPCKTKQYTAACFNVLDKLFVQCADFRHSGSAALDLAYVAAGRVDGFFDMGLKPWNFAGGELLVRESGGVVTDFIGGHNAYASGNVVAGTPRVVKNILAVLRQEWGASLKG